MSLGRAIQTHGRTALLCKMRLTLLSYASHALTYVMRKPITVKAVSATRSNSIPKRFIVTARLWISSDRRPCVSLAITLTRTRGAWPGVHAWWRVCPVRGVLVKVGVSGVNFAVCTLFSRLVAMSVDFLSSGKCRENR